MRKADLLKIAEEKGLTGLSTSNTVAEIQEAIANADKGSDLEDTEDLEEEQEGIEDIELESDKEEEAVPTFGRRARNLAPPPAVPIEPYLPLERKEKKEDEQKRIDILAKLDDRVNVPVPDPEAAVTPIVKPDMKYFCHVREVRVDGMPMHDIRQMFRDNEGTFYINDQPVVSTTFSNGKAKWQLPDGKIYCQQ